MLIYYRMYNDTLNYFSFDIIYAFICYIVLCNIFIFNWLVLSVEIVNLKKLQKSINEMNMQACTPSKFWSTVTFLSFVSECFKVSRW